MDSAFLDSILGFGKRMWEGFTHLFVGEDLLIQLLALTGVFGLAYLLFLGIRPLVSKSAEFAAARNSWLGGAVEWFKRHLFRMLLVTLLWSVSLSFDSYHREDAARRELLTMEVQARTAAQNSVAGRPVEPASKLESPKEQAVESAIGLDAKNYILIRAVASVATLLLVSGALPLAVRKQPYFKALFFVLAVGLMLNLLSVWAVIRDGLNSLLLLPLSGGGETRVTALTLLKGTIAILIVIPLTGWIMRVSETRIDRVDALSPALRALIIKIAKSLVVVVAVLFAISAIGVDLSALTVLGGAIGLGLGFGFQKVVSNLVSGVILLGDRSIKPGDVIEVDDTYGWINRLSARYASVITRDGTEHLIPNETLITEKVVNWSFSDDKVRIKSSFGVSYTSDIHKASKLALQAAAENPRVLTNPEPVVRLMGFGDNSVDFELRFWIRDPSAGVNNVRSDLYFRIWDLFKENGVEFPYPQRDLHIKDAPVFEVRMKDSGDAGER